jgi:hypothetical protein
MHFLLFSLIGLIAVALAGRVLGGRGYAMLGDILVGGRRRLRGGLDLRNLPGRRRP